MGKSYPFYPQIHPQYKILDDIIPDMSLTRAEVDHIAVLARLELTEEEKDQYRQQLSDILEYAAKLQTVSTENIPPTSSVLPPRSVLRPDVAEQSLSTEEVLSSAPETENHQFRVPPVLE